MKTREEITQRVMELACEVYGDDIHVRHITPKTDLDYDFGFDSLDLTEFDIKLEKEFDVSICYHDLDNHKISTYVDIIYNLQEDAI